jgi:pimeloyl-ACP methyl ester carboxylesterase
MGRTIAHMRVRVGDVSLWFDVEGSGLVPDGPTMRERPTLLLLHGGPGFDHSLFKPAYGALADVAQVVYLDHRANGRSDHGDPSRWSLDVWADDVRAFCEALEIEKPIVLGWSFGGMVAMNYAARHPDHPSKLVFQSTMGQLDLDRIAEGFRRVGGDEAAGLARAFWSENAAPDAMAGYVSTCLPLYSPTAGEPDESLRPRMNMELLADPGKYMRGMDLLTGLNKVECPTLVIAGEDDPICTIEAMEDIVAALPAEHVQFERIPKAGHFAQRDDPERFFSVLRDFVTR